MLFPMDEGLYPSDMLFTVGGALLVGANIKLTPLSPQYKLNPLAVQYQLSPA